MTMGVAVLLIAWIAALPSTVHACSCRLPSEWGFISPAHGRLPGNAAGVLWFQPDERSSGNLEGRFTAEILEGKEFRQMPVRVSRLDEFSTSYSGMNIVATADRRLQPGATYRFSVDQAGEGYGQVIVTVDQDILQEETDFTLVVGTVTRDVISVAVSGSCSGPLDASLVHIEGRLARDARRWREQLLNRTIVDEEIYWRARSFLCATDVPGRTEAGIGYDLVHGDCGGSRMSGKYSRVLEPGRHSQRMQAYLPGTGIVLETDVRLVDLACHVKPDTLIRIP